MTRLALAFLSATLITGCGVHVRSGYPAPVPAPRIPAPPPAPPRPARAFSAPEIRAKEIDTGYLRARVIYAQEVRAGGGRIARVEGWNDGGGHGRRARGNGNTHGYGKGQGSGFAWGSHELSAPEVHADVIYVKELNARWIDADLIVAQRVDIGRR